jgi:hypothetical protein
MWVNSRTILLLGSLGLAVAAPAVGQAPAAAPDAMHAVAASSITWAEAGVPGFAPGMKLAVIDWDPSGTGPYTVRELPDGIGSRRTSTRVPRTSRCSAASSSSEW